MTPDGLPVERGIHASSEADITSLKVLGPQLPTGGVLYADAASTGYAWENTWREVEHVDLQADRRTNRKQPHEP